MTEGLIVVLVLTVLVVIVIAKTAVVVPQQSTYVVERLGKYRTTLRAGFYVLLPFFDRIRYRHSLKEMAVDIPEQVCITRDNVQVHVDGVLYLKVMNPQRASYGVADYLFAISQLAQTTLRSEVGKIDLDRTFEERTHINTQVVNELDKASEPWGIKVLRYEIKNISPPRDVLAPQDLDPPRLRGLVEFVHDLRVDVGALLEGPVQVDLSHLAPECGLGKLTDREEIIRHTVRGPLGIHDLEVQHPVHMDLHVVAGDAHLLGDIHGHFLERMAVTDAVKERQEDVEAGPERGPVLSQPLDHIGALLGHHHSRLGDDDDHEDEKYQSDYQAFGHGLAPFELLGLNPEGEALDPIHAAALPLGERSFVPVLHRPCATTQLRLADGPRGEVLEQRRHLALARVPGARS